MLEVIYAPILDNILPPFQKNSKKEFEINIPFKHSSSLNDNWKGIKVIIYTASGNKIEERIIPRGFNITNDNIRIIIALDEEIRKYLSMGNFYKIQIKYDFGLENDKYNILNSNLGVIKCTGESSLEILGLDNINNVSIYYGNKITGKYSNTDITELPYSYKFDIYNNETGSLYISSGEKLHDSSQDNENNHYDSWAIPKVLEQNQTYKIKYSIKTTNGLKKDIEEFIIAPMTIKPEISDYAVFMAEPLSSIGGIKLFFKQKEDTGKRSINGTWEILRKTENSSWEVVQKIQANLTPIEEFYWIDLTVEQNIKYIYGIREYNSFIYSNLLTIDSLISVDFEDIFLFDGNRQLCVRYNPQISSFKNNIFEQKTDTVGGKYPYIFRNGQTKYKEFPINGLISYQEENNKFFWIEEKEEEQRDTTPFSSELSKKDKAEEVYLERQFKLQVLDWLNNGKPKLFRSSQEGNYLVYLSQVSLTPFDGTFRLIHSFSCTAYEIADNSYEELLKHNIYHQEILDLTDLTDSQKYQQINLEDITDTICVGPKAIARCCTSGESTYKIEDDTFIPLGDNTTINLDLLRAYDHGVTYISDDPSDDNDVPEDESETQPNQLVYSAYKCTSGQDTDFWLTRASTPSPDFYNVTIPNAEGSSYKITTNNSNLEIKPTSVYNQFLIQFKNEVFRYKSPYNALSKSNFNYLVIGCKNNISPPPTSGAEPMYYFSYRPNIDNSTTNGKDSYLYVQRTSYKDGKIIVPLTEDFSKNATNADDYEKYNDDFYINTIRFYPYNARGGSLPENLNIEIVYIGLFEDIEQAENFEYKGETEIKQISDKVFSEDELKIASYVESADESYSLKFTPEKIFSYGNGKNIDKYSQDIDIEIKNIETIQYTNGSEDTVVQYGAKNSNFNYMVSTSVLFDFKQLYEFDNTDSIAISSVDEKNVNGYYDGFNYPQIIYMRQYKINNSIASIKYFLIDYMNQNSDFTNYETSDPVPSQVPDTDVKRYWAGILFTIPAKNNAPEDLNKIARIGTITLNTGEKQYKFPDDDFNSIFFTSKYNNIQLLYLNGYLETLKGEDNKNISYSNKNLNQDVQIKLPVKRISAFREKQNASTQPWKGQQYIQPSNINVEGIELLPQLSGEKAMYNRYYYNDELGVLNCKTVSGIKNTEPGYAIVPINNEPALTLNLTNFSPYSKFYLGDKNGENKQEYLVGITGSLTLNNLPKDQEYFLIADKTLNGYQKGIINYSYNEKAIDNSLDSIASIEYIPATLQSFPQWDEDFDAQEQYDVIDGIHRQLGENGVLGYIYYIKLEKTQIPDGTPYPPDYYHQYSFDGKTWNNLLDENGAVKEIKGKLYLEHFYIRRGIIVQCSFDGWEINKREKGVV